MSKQGGKLSLFYPPQMDRSNLEDDPEDGDVEEEGGVEEASVLAKLDFYQADPFAHCHAGRMFGIPSLSFPAHFILV